MSSVGGLRVAAERSHDRPVAWQFGLIRFDDDPEQGFLDRPCLACRERTLAPRRGETVLGAGSARTWAGDLASVHCLSCGSAYNAKVVGVEHARDDEVVEGRGDVLRVAFEATATRVSQSASEMLDEAGDMLRSAADEADLSGWMRSAAGAVSDLFRRGHRDAAPEDDIGVDEEDFEDPRDAELRRRFEELEKKQRRDDDDEAD